MKYLLALALAIAAGTPAAAAVNMVINPGFETGNFSGWTLEDTSGNTRISAIGHNGSAYRADLGSVDLNGINQNIATIAGQEYNFSFYVRGDAISQSANPSNRFQAFFGSNKVYGATNLPANGGVYGLQSFNLFVTSAVTNIRFAVLDEANFIALDDVSVTAATATTPAVPESATWGMMILGMSVVGFAMRRRQTVANCVTSA